MLLKYLNYSYVDWSFVTVTTTNQIWFFFLISWVECLNQIIFRQFSGYEGDQNE